MSTRIGGLRAGSTDLPPCPCGNTTRWTNVTFGGGKVTAECADCGRTVIKQP